MFKIKRVSETGLASRNLSSVDKTVEKELISVKRALWMRACFEAQHPPVIEAKRGTAYHTNWRNKRDQIYRELLQRNGL